MDGCPLPGRAPLGGEQYDGADIGLGVPLLDGADRGVIPHQDGMHPFSEELLGDVGIVRAGAQEIAERAEDPTIEAVARREQGGGAGRQADPVPLQFPKRLMTGGELGNRLLGPAAIGACEGLVFASLGEEMSGPFCICRGGAVRAEETLSLGGQSVPPLRGGIEFLAQTVPERACLYRTVAERGQVRFQRGALTFERTEGLRLALECLFHLAYLCPLLCQPRLHRIFHTGSTL